MSDLPGEFDRIARHFRPLAGPGALDLGDDAAVFLPPAGREIVIAADAMVQGVHFLPDDPADLVARKLLRTNLSDLAAMGATPFGYLMTVSVPRGTPDAWFASFSAGLAADQATFGLAVLGGDTTSTPGPISLSLTILGTVAPGQALRNPATAYGSAAPSAMARWACWRRKGKSRTRTAVWPTATACPARASPSAPPWSGSPMRRWISRTGWCKTSAISAAPAGWRQNFAPPTCRSPPPPAPLTGWHYASPAATIMNCSSPCHRRMSTASQRRPAPRALRSPASALSAPGPRV